MPILKINILGSNIDIDYQENEKDKLLYLIEQFKLRLSEFNNLSSKFSDNKIIFLAALKSEDTIIELKEKLDIQKKASNSINNQSNLAESKIREIVILKDQITTLNNKNKQLEKQNSISVKAFDKLNKQIIALTNKIIHANKNDN